MHQLIGRCMTTPFTRRSHTSTDWTWSTAGSFINFPLTIFLLSKTWGTIPLETYSMLIKTQGGPIRRSISESSSQSPNKSSPSRSPSHNLGGSGLTCQIYSPIRKSCNMITNRDLASRTALSRRSPRDARSSYMFAKGLLPMAGFKQP